MQTQMTKMPMVGKQVGPRVGIRGTHHAEGVVVRSRDSVVAALREAVVRAREETVHLSSEWDGLMALTCRNCAIQKTNDGLAVAMVRSQKVAEDADQANHLKDEVLAAIAHELRTPLNAVVGWARLLGSQQLPPDRARHAITAIDRSALALAHMIDDLLDVSQIGSGTLRLALQPVDLVAVAQAALDAVRPLAATKNVQLALTGSPRHRTVSGDADRLQQVIWNLLTNAIKFTPEGGRVDVFIEHSTDQTDQIEVRVVDTGHGIRPDFLTHVFERYSQDDSATTQRHAGLGLGLAIVRQLVELHGGSVHAASEGVERGATFTVCLPSSAGEAQEGQARHRGRTLSDPIDGTDTHRAPRNPYRRCGLR